jgi:hypothetical protein
MRKLEGMCAVMVLILSGCDDFNIDFGGKRYQQDFHFSYPLSAGGNVRIENRNGSVEISGWDRETVEIDGTKYAGTESRLNEIKIDVVASKGAVAIRTMPPPDRFGGYGARYVIHVPLRAELGTIETSNGAIRVTGIDGSAYLRTSNGSIHAAHMQGLLDIQTSNGSVELSDVAGDTTVHTSNGRIRGDVRKGGFDARTSNGSIDVQLREADSKPVRAMSSNGHITLTMESVREVRASTSNSSITVRMPGTAAVNLRANTSNASVDTDFVVTAHGVINTRHRLEGIIGAGGPLVDLTTSNGGIHVTKL